MLIIIVIVGGKLLWSSEESGNSGPATAQKKGPAKVNGIIVTARPLQDKLFLTGTLQPNERIDLFPEIQGRVTELKVQEGSHVQAGDILLKIQDTDLQAQLRKNKAQTEQIQAQEIRMKKLLAIQGVSQEDYEAVFYQLQTLQAEADLIRSQLDKTVIRAPFSGVVGLRYISAGAMVNPSVRILSLQKTHPLKLDFAVPEKYAPGLKAGHIVQFSTQTDSGIYTARIMATEGQVDVNSRTLLVRALCNENNNQLIPGSFARVELKLQEDPEAIRVPAISLIPVLKGQMVLVSRKGLVEEVAVETGLRTESEIQILKGLQPGDTVLTSGIMSLKPGSPVQVNIEAGN